MHNVDYLIQIEIDVMVESKLRVGDKLSGTCGNKGTVSSIIPDHMMPYDSYGRIYDVVMNPSSIYKRQNLAQIFESASGEIHMNMRRREVDRCQDLKAGFAGYDELNFDYLRGMILNNGVRGPEGKIRSESVIGGYMHIIKSIHTSSSKLTLRGMGGGYSAQTHQPLRLTGHSYHGHIDAKYNSAQRFGVMECTSLIAGNGLVNLDEILNSKSDNHQVKNNIYMNFFTGHYAGYRDLGDTVKLLQSYLKVLGVNLTIEDSAKMRVMSDKEILSISKGEVLRSETYHYRRTIPVDQGLFDPRIFGTNRDFTCSCGKYIGAKYRGVRCETCGVEVDSNKNKRGWFGHMSLHRPMVNLGILNHSLVTSLLGINFNKIQSIAYYEEGVFVMEKSWKLCDVSEADLVGARAIQHIIKSINYEDSLSKI